jgi:N6-L-threonylcarbamoyladenine synthase
MSATTLDGQFMMGIETSCDETSVALLDGHGSVRSNLIASQIARHQPFGGVVPEIASREHLQHLMPVLDQALKDAGANLRDVGAISVTSGPGLIGALLVGVAAAQGLSYGLGIPLVSVNHLEGHMFSPYLRIDGAATPMPSRFLTLVVSGGHSSVYDVRASNGSRTVATLNRTRDDAAGEIFDKVAKFLGLPYPGGPHVERVGRGGDPNAFAFPMAQFKDEVPDFSFSGLKSTAIRTARERGLAHAPEETLADFCASFQRAIIDQIVDRLDRLWTMLESRGDAMPVELGVAGGVAANTALRERIASWCAQRGVTVRLAERRYCTDNAAMIAFAGLQRMDDRETDPRVIKARARAPL